MPSQPLIQGFLPRLFLAILITCFTTTFLLHHVATTIEESNFSNAYHEIATTDTNRHSPDDDDGDPRRPRGIRKKNRHRPNRTSQNPHQNAIPKGIRRNTHRYRHQYALRDRYDRILPPSDTGRMLSNVHALRERRYVPLSFSLPPYDVFNCPARPPTDYPRQWKLLDLIEHWNPDDVEPREEIYQGLCVFDYRTEFDKAEAYRRAEVPFVLRDDPRVLQAAERWSQPDYIRELLSPIKSQRTEFNKDGNHLMYWKGKKKGPHPDGWTPPTSNIRMTYDEWLTKAHAPAHELAPDKPHWYFRLNGNICENGADCENGNEFLYDELSFFEPTESFYMIDPLDHRGINCRFGMKGVIAENHFDGSRNWIVLLGGERRYVLAHPDQCDNLCLYPKGHPSGRHSAVDWSDPDLDRCPAFRDATANEIVLQAGDALYLPTMWFHYIINLGVNWQCNARSGITNDYARAIHKCGF